MSNKSPLTEIVVDPICKKISNFLNYSAIRQLCCIFLTLSLYYYFNDDVQKSSILYLLYFLCSNCLLLENNKYKLNYILINIFYILFILSNNSCKSNLILISLLVSSLCIISNSITSIDNIKDNHLKKFSTNISKSIYPTNDSTKKHHINNFWVIFDFTLFSLFVFILMNMEKNENIYFYTK